MQKQTFLSERTSLIAPYVSDQVQSKLFDLRLHGVLKGGIYKRYLSNMPFWKVKAFGVVFDWHCCNLDLYR